jgi:hypothetical protein
VKIVKAEQASNAKGRKRPLPVEHTENDESDGFEEVEAPPAKNKKLRSTGKVALAKDIDDEDVDMEVIKTTPANKQSKKPVSAPIVTISDDEGEQIVEGGSDDEGEVSEGLDLMG